jgi:dTDP-glucose 4,6-dehydratase
MRYLVTGGAGFIGLTFVNLLARNFPDIEIIVLDKLTYAAQEFEIDRLVKKHKIKFVKADIADKEITLKTLKHVDVVVNFAAESHVDRSIQDSIPFVYTNAYGVQVLLENALTVGVKKFIQISTDEVYGSIDLGSWNENSPVQPNSPYAASKAAGDLFALAFWKTHGLDIRITRSSNNYGPGQYPEKLIPKAIAHILNNESIKLYGNGTNTREWIHVEDHCRGILRVIELGSAGEIYNIGTGIHKSNNEISALLINLAKPDFSSTVEFIEDRKGHDQRYSLDFSKISNLGFTAKIPFESGLKETFDWYRALFKKL